MASIPKFRAFKCALGTETSTKGDAPQRVFPKLLVARDDRPPLRIFSVHEARGRRAGTNQPLDDVAREARAQEEILIKIDMQGYEEKVLLGGVDLIARARLLTIEVSFKTLYEREVLF